MFAIHVMNASRNGLNWAEMHSIHFILVFFFSSLSLFPYSHSILSFLDSSDPIRRCGLGVGNSFLLSSLILFIHRISKRTNLIRITSTKSSQRMINRRLFDKNDPSFNCCLTILQKTKLHSFRFLCAMRRIGSKSSTELLFTIQ